MKLKSLLIIPLALVLSCKANDNPSANTASNLSGGANISELYTKEDGTMDYKPIMGGASDVTITLKDHPVDGKVRIVGFYVDQNYIVDTTICTQGIIHYKNPKGLPQGMYFFSMPNREDYIQVIMGEDQEFEMEASVRDIMGTMVVKGSEENQLFYETMKFETPLSNQLNNLNTQLKGMTESSPDYEAKKKLRDEVEAQRFGRIKELYEKNPNLLFTSFKYGGQNPKIHEELSKDQQVAMYRQEFWDNVNFKDDRLLRTPMIGNKMKRYFKELTAQNPDSLFSAAKTLIEKVDDKSEYFKVFANWVVLNYEPTKCDLMDAEAVFVNMVQNYFTKEKAFWQDTLMTPVIQKRAYEMAQSLIGKPAPNVISTDQFGKPQELLKKTADYLVVYMFNPECEHCQEETPKLWEYYNQHKNEVDVFAIAIETEDKKWKDYINKLGLTWTSVFDPSNRSIYAKYYVDITPEMYLINKDRKIIGKNLKTFQIQTLIDRDKAAKN